MGGKIQTFPTGENAGPESTMRSGSGVCYFFKQICETAAAGFSALKPKWQLQMPPRHTLQELTSKVVRESEDLGFILSILGDLSTKGVASEHFQEGILFLIQFLVEG